jgi:hypothetical protein
MQKNYREYTVGELLDLGLNVEVKKHGLQSIEQGKVITQMFEGAKQSTARLTANLAIAKAWKGNFNVTVYVPTE